MKATVYKSTGTWYLLRKESGEFVQARIKGKLKIDGITSTNPVAVGDWVTITFDEAEGLALITAIDKRKNYINRLSPHNRNQHHIIASNIDQSLLFATIREPKTSFGFIDRFLVTAEAYAVPAIIVINKSDLFRNEEHEKFEMLREIYNTIGYQVVLMSMATLEGVDDVIGLLKDKITLVSGHSGVGKSSFISHILPERDLKTREVSEWSGKGVHTTTFAEMYDLSFGGSIIDTPGIRELGLVDISKQELAHYFPEMRAVMSECRFNNCIHLDEPGCAVKDAVNRGVIHPERYISYLNIRDSIELKTY